MQSSRVQEFTSSIHVHFYSCVTIYWLYSTSIHIETRVNRFLHRLYRHSLSNGSKYTQFRRRGSDYTISKSSTHPFRHPDIFILVCCLQYGQETWKHPEHCRNRSLASGHFGYSSLTMIHVSMGISMVAIFPRSDQKWPNGGHFSSQKCINWPIAQKLCCLAILPCRPELCSGRIRILRHQPFPDPIQDGRTAAILVTKIP